MKVYVLGFKVKQRVCIPRNCYVSMDVRMSGIELSRDLVFLSGY